MKKTTIIWLFALLSCCIFGCQTVDADKEIPPLAPDTTVEETEKQTVAQSEKKSEETTAEATAEPEETKEPKEPKETAGNPEETTGENAEETSEPPTDESETSGDQHWVQPPAYATIDDYFQTVWEKQYGQNGDVGVNGVNQQITMPVPVLNSDEYVLVCVEDQSGSGWFQVNYYFELIEEEANGVYDYIVITYCTLPPDDTLLERGYNSENGCAQFATFSILGIDGHCFKFQYSKKMIEPNTPITPEMLHDLLDYELYTYSPTAETDAVQ